jgi:hypothetical protein
MTTSIKKTTQELRFGSSPDFETILTIKTTPLQCAFVELKFETMFTKAKDAQARQVKVQFFLSKVELIALGQKIQNAVVSDLDNEKKPTVWLFEVDAHGTVYSSNFQAPSKRREFYDNISNSWSDSPDELLYAMQNDCEPLAWAVHNIYTNERDTLIERIDKLQNEYDTAVESKSTANNKNLKKALGIARLALEGWPEEPEEGVGNWLETLSKKAFIEKVVPFIKQWFEEEPDAYESDWLPDHHSAQGLAKWYFETLDDDIIDFLGIVFVEGECYGNGFQAAQLTMDVDQTNQIAKERSLDIHFVKL